MKQFRIITVTKNFWKPDNLIKKVELKLEELSNEGFEIVSVYLDIIYGKYPLHL
jgi:hypothetical protein